ncbi:MAG: hemolysin family protein [Bacteroidales bacterium]
MDYDSFKPEFLIATAIISLLVMAVMTALERAFGSIGGLQFEMDKKQEKSYALITEELLDKEAQLISSLRLAYSLFLIIFGISSALLFSNIITGVIISFLLVVVISKIIPIAVATINAEFVSENLVYVARIVMFLFSPFVKRSAKGITETKEEDEEMMIFQNALNFPDVKVKECMIPRTEICSIRDSASNEELLTLFADSKYSRIIVYSDNIDKITGYIHSKDLFGGGKPMDELIRKIDFVSEEMEAQKLLKSMIKNKRSIAVVKDEYGGTAGIVTLEDLIEEIFGEISDELDKDEFSEKKISDDEYIFPARMEIKYLNKTYDLDIPESDDYETLGGFITWFHENIPVEGEVLRYRNFEITILKTSSIRLESVGLRIVED